MCRKTRSIRAASGAPCAPRSSGFPSSARRRTAAGGPATWTTSAASAPAAPALTWGTRDPTATAAIAGRRWRSTADSGARQARHRPSGGATPTACRSILRTDGARTNLDGGATAEPWPAKQSRLPGRASARTEITSTSCGAAPPRSRFRVLKAAIAHTAVPPANLRQIARRIRHAAARFPRNSRRAA